MLEVELLLDVELLIRDALDRRMVVMRFPDLREFDPPPEVIDHLLVAPGIPPFDRVVPLPPRGEEPERLRVPPLAFDRAEPLLLHGCQVYVATVLGRLYPQARPTGSS